MRKLILAALTLVLLLGLTPGAAAQPDNRGNDCQGDPYLPSRLAGGMMAQVIPNTSPNNVRAEPTLDAPQTGSAEPGAPLFVTTSPACSDGLVFWQVQFRDFDTAQSGIEDFGWTAEGQNGDYWLEPVLQPLAVPREREAINAGNLAGLQNVTRAFYGAVGEFAWSPDSTQLAISTTGAMWLYDLTLPNADPVMVRTDGIDTNNTFDIAFSPGGDRMLTIGFSIAVWNPSTGEQISSIMPFDLPNDFGQAISADGTRAAVSIRGVDINIIDAQDGTVLHTLTGHDLVGHTAFSPDGNLLVSAGSMGMAVSDSSLHFWDVSTGMSLGELRLGAPNQMMVFSRDGRMLAVTDQSPPGPNLPDSYVLLIDVASRETRLTIGQGMMQGYNGRLSFNADGSILAVSDALSDEQGTPTGHLVRFFDTTSGDEVSSISVPSLVTALAFSPDGSVLALAHEDPNFWGPNRVTLWAVVQPGG